MVIKMIVACDDDGGIGKDNKIPWVCREDMAYFKEQTSGSGNNAVIMGRRTYESLPLHFLPGRKNIVLSQSLNSNDLHPKVSLARNCADALELANGNDEIWIIGGEKVYSNVLRLYRQEIREIHMTRIPGSFDCDTFIKVENFVDFPFEKKKLSEHVYAIIFFPNLET